MYKNRLTGKSDIFKFRAASSSLSLLFSGTLRLLAAALLLFSLAACAPRPLESASLLADIVRQSPPESVPRVEVTYQGAEQIRLAHLYLPETSRAALVLVPGAAEQALEDPRLINFADALRRADFLVLVPQLAGEDHLQVSAGDADTIADAVHYLAASANVDQVGMAALSYAVGPAFLAALLEDTSRHVGFIISIGGYYDIIASITYITTGAFRDYPDGRWRFAEVERRAKWIFLSANTHWVSDPRDADLLSRIARVRRDRPAADVSALEAALGPEGRRVYQLFINNDPDRVPTLITALPGPLQQQIRALDLAALDLRALPAHIILIHGRNDLMVPYTESIKLANALRPGQASIYLLENLQHVGFTMPGPVDINRLLHATAQVLEARDAAPAPGLRLYAQLY